MLKIENPDLFGQVVAKSITKVDADRTLRTWEKLRLVNAVAKAVTRIEEQGCFMDHDAANSRMCIWSQGSNEVYVLESNEPCTCTAAVYGYICWHRVAKRLWEAYTLAEAASESTRREAPALAV